MEVWLRLLLITALDGSEWPSSRPGYFATEERAADTNCIGDWLLHRAGPDTLEKKISKNLLPLLEIYLRYLGYPARRLIYIPATLSRLYTERIRFIISQILLKILESWASNLIRQQNQNRRRWNDVANRFCGLSFIICLAELRYIIIIS